MGSGPVLLPRARRIGLVEDQPVPEQELREHLLGSGDLLAGVLQRAHQVARRLALVVGDPYLGDVADGEQPGQELGVVAVVLALAVGCGLDHLRDGADDAVDAEGGELLLQVEPGDPGLVDAFGLGVDGLYPVGDRDGVVAEGSAADLAGHRVQGDGLYRAGVDVESNESGNIQHQEPLPMGAAWPRLDIDTSIVGLIRGYACRNRGSNFYVLFISSFNHNRVPDDGANTIRQAPLDSRSRASHLKYLTSRDKQPSIRLKSPATMASMAHITNNPPTSATTLPQWGYKAMLLGAAAIWGLSTCIIKDTVAVFPPAWLMGIRFFLAGILLLIVFRKRVAQCLNRETLVAGAIIGLVLAPAYLLNTSGLQFTTASKGTFLTGTYSIMVPFIAWAISKQRPTRYNIAAALLALAGIGFISFSGAGEVSLTFGIGEAVMLASAFFLGLHMAVSARLSDGRDALALSAIQFIVAGLIGMAWGAATEGTPNLTTFADPSVFAGMVYLVVFASCGALCFQNIGIKHVPAAPAALLLSTESLFGVTFAVLFFGDTLTITAIIGFALIAFGIAVSETLPLKKGNSQ